MLLPVGARWTSVGSSGVLVCSGGAQAAVRMGHPARELGSSHCLFPPTPPVADERLVEEAVSHPADTTVLRKNPPGAFAWDQGTH